MAHGGPDGVPVAKFFTYWHRRGFATVLTENTTLDDLMDGWEARDGNVISIWGPYYAYAVALGVTGAAKSAPGGERERLA